MVRAEPRGDRCAVTGSDHHDRQIGDDNPEFPEFLRRLQQIAPTVAYPEFGRYAWKERARGVADALDQGARVLALEDRYDARIEEFRREHGDVLENLRVVYTTSFDDEFSLYTSESYQTTVISEAGFKFTDRSEALSTRNQWFPLEQLEILNEADVIITNSGKGPIDEVLAGNELFQRVRAVQAGQVYSFDYEGVSSFGWALTFLEQFQSIAEQIRSKLA